MAGTMPAASRFHNPRQPAWRRRSLLALLPGAALGAPPSQRNLVYGMQDGAALLLDVHQPLRPLGRGLVFIAGSGWTRPYGYAAPPLKESPQLDRLLPAWLDAGYTVFALNHRSSPGHRHPAALEDAQRAVRFIRHEAARFGIAPYPLGGYGGSSGGHLIALLGTLGGCGDPADPDPIQRLDARLQCVVARAAPMDIPQLGPTAIADVVALYFGSRLSVPPPVHSAEYRQAWQASPLAHVDARSAPMLLLHGELDRSVPLQQSERMAAALREAGVAVRLRVVPAAGHGPNYPGASEPFDEQSEILPWLKTHLLEPPARQTGGC